MFYTGAQFWNLPENESIFCKKTDNCVTVIKYQDVYDHDFQYIFREHSPQQLLLFIILIQRCYR